VDGTLKENHLLTLLLIVNLLRLRHFVILGHLQVVLAEGAPCLFNLRLLGLVLTTMHDFFRAQAINLLFSQLALDFSFFATLVSVGLLLLARARTDSCGHGGSFSLFLALVTLVGAI